MQKKFDSYQKLLVFLDRHDFYKPGKLATFLFDVFVIRSKKFTSADAQAAGVYCVQFGWDKWLSNFEHYNLVEVDRRGIKHGNRGIMMGSRLVPFFNNDINDRFEVARNIDLQELQAQMLFRDNLLKCISNKLGIPFDPPDFTELIKYLAKDIDAPF